MTYPLLQLADLPLSDRNKRILQKLSGQVCHSIKRALPIFSAFSIFNPTQVGIRDENGCYNFGNPNMKLLLRLR